MVNTSSPFQRNVYLTLLVLVCMLGAFAVFVHLEAAADQAADQRYNSILLADELRHSSDALTEAVRLYVVTGKPEYVATYEELLAVRDGLKPWQDEHLSRAFTRLVLGERLAQGPRPVVALLELMSAAGFTEDEFALVARAKALSDQLTRTERQAMQWRQAQGPDAAALHAQALAVLYDSAYLAAKADIMEPIDQFQAHVMGASTRALP